MFSRLVDKSWNLAQKIGTYIPFTYWRLIYKNIDLHTENILDIGCADGDMMSFINNRHSFCTVGMDIHKPYLLQAKRSLTHSHYFLGDAGKLPFKDKCFDAVLLLEIIEHLEFNEGKRAIEEAERVARTEVIISTPVAFTKQEAYSGNPHQEHRSFWSPAEMRQRGYRVIGIGAFENWLVENVRSGMLRFADKVTFKKRTSSKDGGYSISHAFKMTDFLLRLPYYLIPGPVVYFLPKFAGHMVCIKRLEVKA